ncbi:hypothetical protein AGOR_G00006850 [Albula goreensis]|uniref:Ubiquinone biosynthesis protein n=1 Tax=Albula goreensis TaxID=1534307 RepID=A0A8T3E8L3_9TELE|nr:hypothetical protein AGOR_G00006850 [Albula goreensis]
MAALLRGLRAGRALRGLGSGMVMSPCCRVQRGFHQAALLRLQDGSKSDQLTTTASSSSSPTHQQHFQASEKEVSVPVQETPTSVPNVPESPPLAPELEVCASAPEQGMSDSASTLQPEMSASVPTPVSVQEVSASALEQGASAPEQEVSASASEKELSSSAPEQEVSASASEQEVPASASEQEVPASASEQEVPASASEQEASVSASEQEVSASATEKGPSESALDQEASSSASQQASIPEQEASAPEQEASEPSSSTDQSGEESEGEYETEEQLQQRILTAALDFVPQYGWSVEAISAGAQTLGLSSAAAGMFINGAGDLILHFIAQCNTELTQILAQQHNQVQLGESEPMETAEFLRYAVEARLKMLIPHIDTWPQAVSILLLPHNIPNSLKHLSTMIDDIWYYAGDRSTDMNWYTRRAALTGVYNTSELVMLQDSSPDFQDTWIFLDKRIQDIIKMADTATQVQATGEAVVQGIIGAAVTLTNLAGMNQRR